MVGRIVLRHQYRITAPRLSELATQAGTQQAQLLVQRAETSNEITLKGSVEIVTEFFNYSINT
jgi:hypothetical protein